MFHNHVCAFRRKADYNNERGRKDCGRYFILPKMQCDHGLYYSCGILAAGKKNMVGEISDLKEGDLV